MQTPKAVLFDFDGTLADTFELAVKVVNDLGPGYRLKELTREQFRNQGSRESFRAIGLPAYRLPGFVVEARARMRDGIGAVELFPGISDLIRDLRGAGVRLGILSSNSEENVRMVLGRFELTSSFEEIVTGSSLFGKHRLMRKLLKRMRLDLESAVFVGDETRDVEACRKVGLACVPVAWGFHAAEVLRASLGQEPARTVAELRARLVPAG